MALGLRSTAHRRRRSAGSPRITAGARGFATAYRLAGTERSEGTRLLVWGSVRRSFMDYALRGPVPKSEVQGQFRRNQIRSRQFGVGAKSSGAGGRGQRDDLVAIEEGQDARGPL